MCPRLALPASAPSSLRQIRYDSPSGRTSMSRKSSLVSGRYDQGRCSFRLERTARRNASSSAASMCRRKTCSPRWSVPALITETVPGRLQRDGRGDGGRRDDRRAGRLRRTGGGRRRARAGPRSTRRERRQRGRVGRRGRRDVPRPRPDRFGRRRRAAARRADRPRGRTRPGDRPDRRDRDDARGPRAARTLDGGGPRRGRAALARRPARTPRGGRRPRVRVLAAVRADLGGRRSPRSSAPARGSSRSTRRRGR